MKHKYALLEASCWLGAFFQTKQIFYISPAWIKNSGIIRLESSQWHDGIFGLESVRKFFFVKISSLYYFIVTSYTQKMKWLIVLCYIITTSSFNRYEQSCIFWINLWDAVCFSYGIIPSSREGHVRGLPAAKSRATLCTVTHLHGQRLTWTAMASTGSQPSESLESVVPSNTQCIKTAKICCLSVGF